jgi:hypothetical protein
MNVHARSGVGDMPVKLVAAGELIDVGAKADPLDDAFNSDLFCGK